MFDQPSKPGESSHCHAHSINTYSIVIHVSLAVRPGWPVMCAGLPGLRAGLCRIFRFPPRLLSFGAAIKMCIKHTTRCHVNRFKPQPTMLSRSGKYVKPVPQTRQSMFAYGKSAAPPLTPWLINTWWCSGAYCSEYTS